MTEKTDRYSFQERFGKSDIITLKDIDSFYRETDPSIPGATVNWRVHALVQSGILRRIGKGLYQLGEEQPFAPKADVGMKKIGQFVGKRFPFISYCLWDLSCVNYFSRHLIDFNVRFIDVERDVVDSVYYALKEKFAKVMSIRNLYGHLSDFDNTVFVRPLVTESPVRKADGLFMATLEKMLVDMATDKELVSFQENEIYTIFGTAFEKYTVNRNTLIRYASRKNKKDEIERIINYIDRQ
ncbi:MAG: hypothetical protein LBD35_05695 [Prevotellaceae bacterium]|jgi:hypothetical protein|nr:hypothetical protein [Prevotellaceae bacterium]